MDAVVIIFITLVLTVLFFIIINIKQVITLHYTVSEKIRKLK